MELAHARQARLTQSNVRHSASRVFLDPGGVAPCEPCAAGSFQERPGAASCLQCAQGNSTLAPGASHRSQCIGSAPDSTNPSAIPRLAQNRSSSHRLVNSHEGDADVCVLAKSQRCVETDDWHGERGCDDGNAAAGDGCSLSCAVEEGFKCATPPAGGSQRCKWVGGCGDGKRTNGEECDDGNTVQKDP